MKTWNVTYTAGTGTRKGLVKLPDAVAPGSATLGTALKAQLPSKANAIQVVCWTRFPG